MDARYENLTEWEKKEFKGHAHFGLRSVKTWLKHYNAVEFFAKGFSTSRVESYFKDWYLEKLTGHSFKIPDIEETAVGFFLQPPGSDDDD